jgi:hypothetical protein
MRIERPPPRADAAAWDLAVAKDPVVIHQKGAPPGFAKVPPVATWRSAAPDSRRTEPVPVASP